MAYYQTLLSVVLLASSVVAYPRREPNGYTQTTSGTCASIGYTTGCCPPDEDCMATDSDEDDDDCYCSSDCYMYEDCCSDIVNICPSSPSTCTELGFTDRCCVDELNLGHCEIESSGCSCKVSCFVDKNCCPGIGCLPSTCAEAGLDPGCCQEECNVTYYGSNKSVNNCYCDARCRQNGDCCTDVDQTKQCNPACTLTIRPGESRTKAQQARPRLQPLALVERYQNRLRKFKEKSQVFNRQSSTQRAYVDERNNMRERLASLLESKRGRAQVQRNNRRY